MCFVLSFQIAQYSLTKLYPQFLISRSSSIAYTTGGSGSGWSWNPGTSHAEPERHQPPKPKPNASMRHPDS